MQTDVDLRMQTHIRYHPDSIKSTMEHFVDQLKMRKITDQLSTNDVNKTFDDNDIYAKYKDKKGNSIVIHFTHQDEGVITIFYKGTLEGLNNNPLFKVEKICKMDDNSYADVNIDLILDDMMIHRFEIIVFDMDLM